MKIEGVPDGWELVRIGTPIVGEYVITHDGDPDLISAGRWLGKNFPIIRRIEPVCTWQYGVFADGWIAQDKNGSMWWYTDKPELEIDGWDNAIGEVHNLSGRSFMLKPPVFRPDLYWDNRIQQVGPAYEATLK